MKKRKKKNNERAFALKYTKLINLPIKNNIKFKKSNLINERKKKNVLIKTHRILLFPTPKQKDYLINVIAPLKRLGIT